MIHDLNCWVGDGCVHSDVGATARRMTDLTTSLHCHLHYASSAVFPAMKLESHSVSCALAQLRVGDLSIIMYMYHPFPEQRIRNCVFGLASS